MLVYSPFPQIYVVHALPSDYFVRKDGQAYDRTHYYANPQDYSSVFHSEVSHGEPTDQRNSNAPLDRTLPYTIV